MFLTNDKKSDRIMTKEKEEEKIELRQERVIKVSFYEIVKIIEFKDDEDDRKSNWERVAADRDRFLRRIEETKKILTPVLSIQRRQEILKHRMKNNII
nr:MAG: hypothetical protein [Porcellio scaber clopovirus]